MFLCIGLFFALLPARGQDFISLHLKAEFDTINEVVIGEVYQDFIFPDIMDTIVLNAVRIEVESLLLNGAEVDFKQNDTALFIPVKYNAKRQDLRIKYTAKPRKGIYFVGWQDESRRAPRQIWTQGQGIDHRHWIPHHDDQTDKILFSAEWIFSPNYAIMSNGTQDSVVLKDGQNHWYYHMDKPMSSYLIALAIGDYVATAQMVKGTPHLLYHYPERITDSSWYYYRHHRIAQFLEEEINYDYPWPNYKQAPVMDFRHGAMENTCATIFGDFFLVDSLAFNDRNYTYVDAHEFAHQWFGNLVTAAGSEHHWLHEGFATYYQWLSERELYGQEFFEWELQKAKDLVFAASERDTFPLAHPKAGVERFYQKGGWLLHMLRDYVGDSIYRKVIDEYLHTYAYKVVKNRDLIALFEKHSDKDVMAFFDTWLYGSKEPSLKVRRSPIGQELIIDVDVAFPQGLQIGYYKGNGWSVVPPAITLSKGRNRIPLPDSAEYYFIANASDLLIQVDYQYSQEELKFVMGIDTDPWNQIRYLAMWPEKSADRDYLVALVQNPALYHQVRAAAAEALVRVSKEAKKNAAVWNATLLDAPVPLQIKLLQLALKEELDLDDAILAQLRKEGMSYDLRSLALQNSLDPRNPAAMGWLKDAHWKAQPGIVGRDVYLQTLIYRTAFLRDAEAKEELMDFCSISFDFQTRMNAIRYLAMLSPDEEEFWQQLFVGFQDSNWKLVKLSRETLLSLREKYPKSFERQYKKAARNWDDFQKRKAARTFEAD